VAGPVGLLVGFANFLLATWRATEPRAVIVCLDTRVPSYRHDLLPAYQGQRDPFADDLCEQLDRLPELARGLRLRRRQGRPVRGRRPACHSGHAEEARGRCARRLERPRHLSARLRAVGDAHPRPRGVLERVDRAGVRERYGSSQSRCPISSHCAATPPTTSRAPAASGRRPPPSCCAATAILEGVIAHAADLTPRQRLAVESGADDLRRYLDVATMRRNVAMTIPGDAALDPSSAAAWCRDAGMLGLARRLAA